MYARGIFHRSRCGSGKNSFINPASGLLTKDYFHRNRFWLYHFIFINPASR